MRANPSGRTWSRVVAASGAVRARRTWSRVVAASAAAVLAVGGLSACSGLSAASTISFVVDDSVTTYNSGTLDGAFSAARQVFARVQPGFSYIGPDGNPLTDTDFGTATTIPGEGLTVQYRLNPAGVYSDGVPTSCDDLVLTWLARSGRYDKGDKHLFNAARTIGYDDIDRVDCQPGTKDATVVFHAGRGVASWRSLFGPTDILPAHVIANELGVDSIVNATNDGDEQIIAKIAAFWNDGWRLEPGKIDLKKLPSAGPYRVGGFTEDGGLELVENDKWWGQKPRTPRVVVWPKNAKAADRIKSGGADVIDIGAGSFGKLDPEFVSKLGVKTFASRSTEQLLLGTAGRLGSKDARKALAACLPRDVLFDKFGKVEVPSGLGTGTLNSRLVAQDSLLYPAVSAEGSHFPQGDVEVAKGALESAEQPELVVRVGYQAPDARRAAVVKEIALACKPAGITVEDVSNPKFTPWDLLADNADVALVGSAGVSGPAGALDNLAVIASLHAKQGSNVTGITDNRLDELLDKLIIDADPVSNLALETEAESILWRELPSVPLFHTPRSLGTAGDLHGAVPNVSVGGMGWNMDRWYLER